jgi:hypothetical protein
MLDRCHGLHPQRGAGIRSAEQLLKLTDPPKCPLGEQDGWYPSGGGRLALIATFEIAA